MTLALKTIDAGATPSDLVAEELAFFWQDLEAAIGYRSSQGAMVDRLLGFTGTDSSGFTPFESFSCWHNPDGAEAARIGRALRAMRPDHVQVLYRVYGPRDPHARRCFGEIAPIAEYTETVDRHRERMVADRIDQRLRAMHAGEERRQRTATEIAAAARVRIEKARLVIRRLREIRSECGLNDDQREELVAWRQEIRAAERRIEEVLRPALAPDGLERAAQGIRISTNREVTTADALRALLDHEVERARGESGKMFARRQKVADEARATVVGRIRGEAEAMLDEARAAYLNAKEAA